MRAEQAEPVGGRGQRGVVQEWVDQQRAGALEARAINAEAANRDLEAHLSRATEDRRGCESRLADVTKERDRLATKVRTLERDVATSRNGMQRSRAWCGTPPILGVVIMVGTQNFTCYLGAL